jgi:tight adherence protein C
MLSDEIIFWSTLGVALAAFFSVKDYAESLTVRIISKIRLMGRTKKLSHTGGTVVSEKDEDGGIGLKSGGMVFGTNTIFNYIAEKNRGLIEEMQKLLQQAGMRQQNALEEFMKSKFRTCIALFFILLLLWFGSDDTEIPLAAVIPGAIVLSVVIGHKLTNMNLQMAAKKRRTAVENGVPDLVDLLVICTESGLDLNRSIRKIAKELATSNPVLSDELSLTAIELEMIPDHRQVFENLDNRTECMEIKAISKTLSQSIEYGSSLAVSLRDLAVESRQKRMLNAEAKAAQAPTLLTLPMMFCIMPCLFIVMLGPVIVQMIKSFNN